MKKIMSILLVLLMLTSVLASCGGNDETTKTEVPTTEVPTTETPTTEAPTTEAPTTEPPTTEAPTTEAPTTEAPTTEAPTTEAPTTIDPNAPWSSKNDIRDTWKGKQLDIAYSTWTTISSPYELPEPFINDESVARYGEKIQNSVIDRNEFIKNTYGVKLNWIKAANGSMTDALEKAILAGNVYYDIAIPRMQSVHPIVAGGYVYDLANREFIDLNNTYYREESVNTYTAHGHTFFVTGGFSNMDVEMSNVLFVNKKLFEFSANEEMEYLYDLVRKGEWTYDRFCAYAEAGYSDNGDGKWSETDTIGAYIGNYDIYYDNFGVKQAGVNKATGKWEITFNDDIVDDIISAKISACTSVFFEDAGGYGIFEDDLILFLSNQMMYANNIDLKGVSIIPFPMLNKEQGRYYVSCLSGAPALMCIPKTTPDRNMSEYFMDVLCWTGEDYIGKAYIEQKRDKLETESDVEMITDYIIPSISYDAGKAAVKSWKDLLSNIEYDSWEKNENNFDEAYAKREPEALKIIAEWNKAWSSYVEDDPRPKPPVTEAPVHTHTEVVIPGKASTDTQTGLTEGVKCSECGKILKYQYVIPALEIVDGLKFRLNEDDLSYAVIGLGDYADNNLIIPSEYNGLPVTKIEKEAFKHYTILSSVVIPSSVTYIGASAFENCTDITRVDLSEGLTYIGKHAFKGCTSLEEIKMPSSVLKTGVGVFANCTSLKSIEISNGMEYVSNYMFAGCTSLSTVVMPDSVTELGAGVFYNCDSLTTLPLGKNINEISAAAFEDCDGLIDIVIPDNVTYINEKAFYSCDALNTLVVGKGVTYIRENAFDECNNLKSADFAVKEGWQVFTYLVYIDPPCDMGDTVAVAKIISGQLTNYNGRPWVLK